MSFSTAKSKAKYTLLLAFCSFLLAHLLFWAFPGIFTVWDLQSVDQLFRLRPVFKNGSEPVDPNIALVYLDDKGIEKLNEEFRSGEVYSSVTKLLSRSQVGAIGYDIVFARKHSLQNPQELVDAVQQSDNCVTAYAFRLSQQETVIPSAYGSSSVFLEKHLWHPHLLSKGTPLSVDTPFTSTFIELSSAAKGFGFINALPDRDGTFRRIPLVLKYNDGFIPSLPLRMVCDYLEVAPENISIDFGTAIVLNNASFPNGEQKTVSIPIDEQGNMILNFPGEWKAYRSQYSFANILSIADREEEFSAFAQSMESALVLVADVSTGSGDIGPVPVQANYPLSGLHLTVLNSILTQNFLSVMRPSMTYAGILFFLIIIVVVSLNVRPLLFSLFSVLVIIMYIGLAATIFIYMNTIPQVVLPVSVFVLSFGSILAYRYFSEEKEKMFIRKTFSTYFSPNVLKKIEEHPDLLSLGGERKELTVMFSDIVGFTTWSSTQSPEVIKRTVNEYFEEMASIIFKYEGYIDKYIGDGMMAFFGDPVHQDDHALRCVNAAIEMQKKIRELERQWSGEGRLTIQVRIGINSGEMIVGNMGSKSRMDYTVLGANVNLAQRLESNAPVGGILISEAVYSQIRERIATREASEIQVKGLTEKVKVYEVVTE